MVKGARLRTLSRRRSWVQVPSPAPKQDLFAVVYHLKKQGRKETTLVAISRKLRYLARNVDLNQPEKVKEFIANLNCSDGHKDNLIDIYGHYANFYRIHWVKPKYMREERVTRVPKEEDINKIISHAKLKYAVAYSIIRDVGIRPIELSMLKVKDVDLETGEVYPITAKHGAERVLRVKASTLSMLKQYISETTLSMPRFQTANADQSIGVTLYLMQLSFKSFVESFRDFLSPFADQLKEWHTNYYRLIPKFIE